MKIIYSIIGKMVDIHMLDRSYHSSFHYNAFSCAVPIYNSDMAFIVCKELYRETECLI